MAETQNDLFDAKRQLSPNQQDLLLAALSSNNPSGQYSSQAIGPSTQYMSQGPQGHMDGYGEYMQPYSAASNAGLDVFDMNGDPLDYLANEEEFPLDELDESPTADASQLTLDLDHEDGLHAKRKMSEDNEDEEELSGKKREGDDKTAKKPGRKPLTSEPTTKRKAQNRAAQRAFRERKEKHLKDLEDKVDELEKKSKLSEQKSKAADDENGLLRAKVSRLQEEVQAYRKRLSLENSAVARSLTANTGVAPLASGFGDANSFHFEFPRFGTLPGSHVFGPNSTAALGGQASAGAQPPSPQRSNGITGQRVVSSPSNFDGSIDNVGTSPQHRDSTGGSQSRSGSLQNGLASSSSGTLNNSSGPSSGVEAAPPSSRIFRFNSGSVANTDSPSASSVSQYGGQSSCGTSPEPTHQATPKFGEGDAAPGIDEIARNQVEGVAPPTSNIDVLSMTSPPGIDWLASQNGGQFDPLLLGDYRESQAAIVGNGEDFTNGFFNDAWPYADMNSPFNFDASDKTATPALTATRSSTTDVIENIQSGETERGLAKPGPEPLLSCNNIWDELQNRPGFNEGTLDIDSLCSDLRKKARCSESGVALNRKDVSAALDKQPHAATS